MRSSPSGSAASEIARRGTGGAGGPLPHGATIQQLFGRHDVSAVRAHSDDRAAAASEQLGAHAFAHGDRIAFGRTPDLHTAAHEAAHVVQQRAGIQLAGGVGAAGDAHERHADAVADAVVRGESAEPLLDRYGSGSAHAPAGGPVQRKEKELRAALGFEDMPHATKYFGDRPITKPLVLAFIGDDKYPEYERARVRELWSMGYKPSRTARGFHIDEGRVPRARKPAPSRGKNKRARSPSAERAPKRSRTEQYASYAYWNMERLGLSSDPAKIQRYVDYIIDVLETYHPTFLAFEEMGDAVSIFGKLIMQSDLFARYVQHAQTRQPDDSSGSSSEADDHSDSDAVSEHDSELDDHSDSDAVSEHDSDSEPDSDEDDDDVLAPIFEEAADLDAESDDDSGAYEDLMRLFLANRAVFDEARERRMRQHPGEASHTDSASPPGPAIGASYPVHREYGYMPGPQFVSGNFREYYPLIFDKSVVIGTPELLVSRPRDIAEINRGEATDKKLLQPYVRPRPFQAGKDEDEESDDESRTPRGPAFWKIRMKALPHNTRRERRDGVEIAPPEDETLEIYLGIVHTSPGMLNPDIKSILDAAAELIPENKPVIIGGDWYMQRGAKRTWERLQDDAVWALGLPPGTTNYKPGKVCQKADHGMFNKAFVALGGTPIRIQPPSKMPFEGLTGVDQAEMRGEREDEPTAREVKDEVGSDHTNIFMSMKLYPDGRSGEHAKNGGEATDQDGHSADGKTSAEAAAPRRPRSWAAARLERLARPKRSGPACKLTSERTIAPGGKTLHINHTEGDGNCFYHSIFECITGMRSTGAMQRQVRMAAIQAMLTHPDVLRHLFGEIPDEEAMGEVIDTLSQDGTWTEDFTPSFLAEALNLEIHVLTHNGDAYYTAGPTVARSGLRTIYCVFTGDHYNSCTATPLGPVPDAELDERGMEIES